MPGPPPKPNAIRRNLRPEFLALPAEGRKGPPPEWPIGDQSTDELAVWADLWATPPAIMWERLRWTRTVARYCRIVLKAERLPLHREAMSEARQLEAHLGLTPAGLKQLMWTIVEDEVAAQRTTATSTAQKTKRLKAV